MLKVLIVDDEFIIREGLKTIIDWGKIGFEVCDTAINGREGLQKIELCKPDLVIADIKMPVMNGLEMIEEIKTRGYECSIIILTAFSDFSFAQKSVELGIDAYVLKPVEQDDLTEKVLKVKCRIETQMEARQNNGSSIMLSRDKILEGFVTGTIDECMAQKYNKQYNLGFPWECYQVILIDTGMEGVPVSKLKKEMKGLIEKYINQNSYGFVFDIDRYISLLFRNMSDLSLQRILKVLQAKLFESYNVMVTISVGIPVDSLDLLVHSYISADRLLERKFLYGHKQIIISAEGMDAIPGSTVQAPDHFDMEGHANSLFKAMDVNNEILINNLLEDLKNWFLKNKLQEDVIKINYTGLYLTIVGKLGTEINISKSAAVENKDVLDEICKKTSLQELHGYFKYKLLSISAYLACYRPTGCINRILDYIDRNYGRDIKLESLAAMFNYNSTYLGKLFKSQTGQYFNTYLDHIRIEKAKHLLGEGFKVYQVVEKVGIGNIDYFYKKFKKYTGVSPSMFKGVSK